MRIDLHTLSPQQNASTHKNWRKKKRTSLCLLIFFTAALIASCAPQDLNTKLKDVEQNILSYLNPNTEHQSLIPAEKQKALMIDYLAHYFSPWEEKDHPHATPESKVIETELKTIEKFKKNPGWAQNYQLHTLRWMEALEKNMVLSNFPNGRYRAITIENSHLRMVPTQKPSFTNLKEAGQGFPFDNFQTTFLPANTPIKILHTTKDKAWHLVVTHNVFGWMPSHQLALVDHDFIQQWKTGRYLSPAVLEAPLKSPFHEISNPFYFHLRLGHLYPALPGLENGFYTILIAVKDLDHLATIKTIPVEEKLMYETPLPITSYHIALLANEILGQPYGWGGLFGYRDCSSTLADLFTPFGIWLPRNSGDQLQAWKHVSLAGLKNAKKKQEIERQGIPLLTLIGWPGHIMLYLGADHHKIYAFHTAWALQTLLLSSSFSGRTGRAIFGKTVITPLDLGSHYLNIKATLLDKAAVMTFLGEK